MENRRILNIGAVADGDDVVVAAHHAVEPDARAVAEDHGADHDGVVGDVEVSAHPDMAIAEGIDHGFEVRSDAAARNGRCATSLPARRGTVVSGRSTVPGRKGLRDRGVDGLRRASVAEREDVERVGGLAHVHRQLVQMANRGAVVPEPERMRGLALQPRGARENQPGIVSRPMVPSCRREVRVSIDDPACPRTTFRTDPCADRPPGGRARDAPSTRGTCSCPRRFESIRPAAPR